MQKTARFMLISLAIYNHVISKHAFQLRDLRPQMLLTYIHIYIYVYICSSDVSLDFVLAQP